MRKTLELIIQLNIMAKPEIGVRWVDNATVGVTGEPGHERFLIVELLWLCVQIGWFDSDPLPKGESR